VISFVAFRDVIYALVAAPTAVENSPVRRAETSVRAEVQVPGRCKNHRKSRQGRLKTIREDFSLRAAFSCSQCSRRFCLLVNYRWREPVCHAKDRGSAGESSAVPAGTGHFRGTLTRHLNVAARRLASPFGVPGYFHSPLTRLRTRFCENDVPCDGAFPTPAGGFRAGLESEFQTRGLNVMWSESNTFSSRTKASALPLPLSPPSPPVRLRGAPRTAWLRQSPQDSPKDKMAELRQSASTTLR
jgi:hypothetical protein